MRAALVLALAAAGCARDAGAAPPPPPDAATQHDNTAAQQADAATQKEPPRWELVTGEGFQGMIMPGGSWRPARAQVLQLEAGLPAYVGRGFTVDGRPRTLSPAELAGYRRQYVGV